MTKAKAIDVDLLRPGTVPISPDTVLWFEFLLNPVLLETHLNKPSPEPSATNLIVKFLSVLAQYLELPFAPTPPADETGAVPKQAEEPVPTRTGIGLCNRKNLALKILALKVAAHLKWDLGTFEAKLPLPIQDKLLKDLLYVAFEEDVNVEKHTTLDLGSLSPQSLFAVVLYHRWVLRAAMNSATIKQIRLPNVNVPTLSDAGAVVNQPPAVVVNEELLKSLETQATSSVKILSEIDERTSASIPTFRCFVPLTEDSEHVTQDWHRALPVSTDEFHCQINFDVGSYHFHREDYEKAGLHFQIAQQLFSRLPTSGLLYCSADAQEIEGYCAACGVSLVSLGLLNELQRAINNQYMGIVSILQRDNAERTIPQMYRDNLELDIRGATSSGKFTVARELLLQVQTLNVAKRVVSGTVDTTNYLHVLTGAQGLDMMLEALKTLIPSANLVEKDRIKLFLIKLAASKVIPTFFDKLLLCPSLVDLLSVEELEDIRTNCIDFPPIPNILMQTDWPLGAGTTERNSRLRAGSLERRLILSYEPQEIRDVLVILGTVSDKPLWRANNKWELPIPLQSVVMSLPRGFLQDFSYILLAKARELTNNKDFVSAEQLLSIVESEVRRPGSANPNVVNKLTLMVEWELLLICIIQFLLEEQQVQKDSTQLVTDCKRCLGALQAGDSLIPRMEIIEHCAICLLNLGEWEYLVELEIRWKYFGMAAAIAGACLDIGKAKKKVPKDAWELVLPIFGPGPQGKRSAPTAMHRDSPVSYGSPQTRTALDTFLSKVVNPTALATIVSLLARLYNILRDEAPLDFAGEHINVWPNSVSNANSYNSRAVLETLGQVLTQALYVFPDNIAWLKLMADLHFVTGTNHAHSLRYYLEAGIVASDYFSQPIPNAVLDNQIYKRMVKCCSTLQYHTQAAVLCQFLDEVDYSSAFKSLSDSKTSDSMDIYYDCLWDISLLEFLINWHHKKGEHYRKQQAIKVMGLLELNSSNNDEIRREAINVRKARFLHSLARQYVIN